MTDTTQPPAETLAACPFCGADAIWREYDPANPEVSSGLVVDHSLRCFLHWPSALVRDDQSIRASWNRRTAVTRRAGGDDRQWPDIGEDPMKARPYDDRMAVSAPAIRKAYTVQQPIVPDQTALVWRWHLGALLEAEIRLRSILARDEYSGDPDGDEPAPAGGDAGAVERLIASARGHLSNVRQHGNAEKNACMVFERVIDTLAALASSAPVRDNTQMGGAV